MVQNQRDHLQWCRSNGTNRNLTITSTQIRPLPAVFLLPEHQHHALLARVLDPEQRIDPALRLAASLILLYGIRNHEIASLSLADIITTGQDAWIRFGPEPLQLPAGLTGYAREAISERTITRFGSLTQDHQWLFPGLFHDQPIDPTTLSRRLAALGIKPERTRTTAMGQLAQQLPPPILARLIGINASTALRWSAAVTASYARNLPIHLNPRDE
jgi:integrase